MKLFLASFFSFAMGVAMLPTANAANHSETIGAKLQPANFTDRFFLVNNVGYYENDAGRYCHFSTFQQWLASGGPADTSTVVRLSELPADRLNDGECPLRGFFTYNSVGYYQNAAQRYCHFTTFERWLAAGGPQDVSTVPMLSALPANSVNDGECAIFGFFTVNGRGYYQNDQRHYCRFFTYQQWLASDGPEDMNSAPRLPRVPADSIYDGECPVRGFFIFDDSGFYQNAQRHYCQFRSFQHWIAAGGPQDTSTIPDLWDLPNGSTFDGYCPVRGFFIVRNVGYYANNAKQYCYFRDWAAWQAAGGPNDLGAAMHFSQVPADLTFNGQCR